MTCNTPNNKYYSRINKLLDLCLGSVSYISYVNSCIVRNHLNDPDKADIAPGSHKSMVLAIGCKINALKTG